MPTKRCAAIITYPPIAGERGILIKETTENKSPQRRFLFLVLASGQQLRNGCRRKENRLKFPRSGRGIWMSLGCSSPTTSSYHSPIRMDVSGVIGFNMNTLLIVYHNPCIESPEKLRIFSIRMKTRTRTLLTKIIEPTPNLHCQWNKH
jgi:hypothetical protein